MFGKFYYFITVMAFLFPFQTIAAVDSLTGVVNSDAEIPVIVVTAEKADIVDSFEETSRVFFSFNMKIDDLFLEPVARGYRSVVPVWGRDRIGSAVQNLSAPVTFLNNILQLDIDGAFTTFWRFLINSTLGIGGMFDIAKKSGLEYKREDFGQTLAVYGVANGSYIMLPIIGPSTARDTFGLVVDAFTNPFNYLHWGAVASVQGTDAVHNRETLLDTMDEIEETSFDTYATIRSAYIQSRADQILNSEINN